MNICVHDIWISPGHDFKGRHGLGRMQHGMDRVEEVVCDAGLGLAGDRYHGEKPGSKNQVTFLSREVVDEMIQSLEIDVPDYSALRRNILVSGVDLNTLIGKTFSIGKTVFEGVEECKPCYWMDKAVAPGAHAFLAGRGGLRCRILKGGVLRCGEANLEMVVPRAKSFAVLRQQGEETLAVTDRLTEERALQIKVNGRPFSMTMQTPGAERYLVRGLLHAEGVGSGGFLLYAQSEQATATVVEVEVECPDVPGGVRRLAATSSCGICGKESIEDVFREIMPVQKHVRTNARRLRIIHEAMLEQQSTFAGTGGSHAAAIATADGELLCVYEDIGRHNAVDKVIGFILENDLTARADVLAVSGRVSFEIVQKCARAGIPVLAAVSAASSLAVESAEQWGITLAGFCREDRATFYSGHNRVEQTKNLSNHGRS
ncbi:MAG: formate dehydrogenase accessory sulfurtransferase FdhD [Kiritimatiellia bacterium]